MESSCVRQTDIPGTSALFGDYLYHYPEVERFYPAWFQDAQALKAAAHFDYPAERRASVVAALEKQNSGNPALAKLAQPGTVAIVTGQQVGLFSGPAYSIYKILTAVRLARHMEEIGIPAVPVFWLATEDHDLAEVDHTWVFSADLTPSRLSLPAGLPSGGPVGAIGLQDIPIDALRSGLAGLPHAGEVIDLVANSYQPGQTLGGAFRSLLQSILKDLDILFLDPLAPEIRNLGAPFLDGAASRLPELIPALRARNKELVDAGYHAQVNIESDSSLLFALGNGKRIPLRFRNGQLLERGDRPFSAKAPGELSPNALLRPVMQDFLLPTAAYVGGPAEIAYMAQASVLYERLLGRMPVIYPRNGFTLLDARSQKWMAKYQLRFEDLLHNQETVRNTIGSRLVPPALAQEIATLRSSVDTSLDRLKLNLRSFDPTLEAAAEKSATKMLYQLDKISRKTARETFLRDERASVATRYLSNLLYPERHLQERLYSILPFLAQTGLDLPSQLYDYTQLNCPDHMLRVF